MDFVSPPNLINIALQRNPIPQYHPHFERDSFQASQSIRYYVEAGQTLTFRCYRLTNVGNASGKIFISGYLVDAP